MIRFYRDSDQSAVTDLVLGIQNEEYHLGIALSDQADLNNINSNYRDKGGAFWVAEDNSGAVVGCIGLMVLTAEIGVLKKFFVASDFRGLEKGTSYALFSTLISLASKLGIKTIVLDSPSVVTRAHAFYRRAGFYSIAKESLPVTYDYPDRNSLLFMLRL